MKKLIAQRSLSLILAFVAVIFVVGFFIRTKNNQPALVTTTVEVGPVEQLVSVSGITKAKQTVELAFPVGILRAARD